MALPRPNDDDSENKISGLNETSSSPISKSKSFSSLERWSYWDNYEGPQPRAKRRHNRTRSTRRPRRLSIDRRAEDANFKLDTASEKRRDIFIQISHTSKTFLLRYLSEYESACESARSASTKSSSSLMVFTANPSNQCDAPEELGLSTASERPHMSWDQTRYRLDSLSERFSQWRDQLRLSEWFFGGRNDLLEVGNEIFSTLICLAESEIKLLEQAQADAPKTESVLQDIAGKLRTLALEGKKLQLNRAVSEDEFSVRLGDLDAIENCIDRLEELLRDAKQRLGLGQRRRRVSPQKYGPPSSPIATDRTLNSFYELAPPYLSSVMSAPTSSTLPPQPGASPPRPSSLSLSTSPPKSVFLGHKHVHFQEEIGTETVPEHPTKRRISPNPSTAEKAPRLKLNNPFHSAAPSTALQEAGTNVEFIPGTRLFDWLQNLSNLQHLWRNESSTLNMNSLTPDVPPFAIVIISTEPSEVNWSSAANLKVDEEKLEPAFSEDNVDQLAETMSKIRLVDDSLPESITDELISIIVDKYYAIFNEEQARDLLPGFSDPYIKMESFLVLLESSSQWVFNTQPEYLDNVEALLPIIQSYLLDCLFQNSSKFPTRLRASGIPRTSKLRQVLRTVKVLHRFIQHLRAIEISPLLEIGWKRLEQPLEEVFMELDGFHDDLNRMFTCTIHTEEISSKSVTTQLTQLDETMDWTQNSCDNDELGKDSVLLIPDMMILPPIFLLFHFTHNNTTGERSSDNYAAPGENFIALQILHETWNEYGRVKNDEDLGETFHAAGRALKVVRQALSTAEETIQDNKALCVESRGSLSACSERARLSKEIFSAAAEQPVNSRLEGYIAAVKQVSNGTRVERLIIEMMENICDLAKDDVLQEPMAEHVERLRKTMELLSEMEPSM